MYIFLTIGKEGLNSLKAELNPICHLPAILGAHHILHVSRIRVKVPTRNRVSRVAAACGGVTSSGRF